MGWTISGRFSSWMWLSVTEEPYLQSYQSQLQCKHIHTGPIYLYFVLLFSVLFFAKFFLPWCPSAPLANSLQCHLAPPPPCSTPLSHFRTDNVSLPHYCVPNCPTFTHSWCLITPVWSGCPTILLFRIPVRECARTLWIGAPFWRERDRVPQAGTKSVSWAQTREEERRDKMRRWQEVKEDDPFMASRCEHAQSEFTCIIQEESM
jgi:hypothetical protein